MSSTPVDPLEYAPNPKPAALDLSEQLSRARRWALVGLFVPLISLGAIGYAGLAFVQRPITVEHLRQARRWLVVGIIGLILTSVVSFAGLGLLATRHVGNIYCPYHLRNIGMSIEWYARDRGDRVPPDFRTLYEHEDMTLEMFCCPSPHSDDRAVAPYPPTRAQQAATIVEGTATCSYYLVRFGDRPYSTLQPATVVAFEKPGNHGDYMHFQLANGVTKRAEVSVGHEILSELAAGQNPPPSLNRIP